MDVGNAADRASGFVLVQDGFADHLDRAGHIRIVQYKEVGLWRSCCRKSGTEDWFHNINCLSLGARNGGIDVSLRTEADPSLDCDG